MLTEAQRAICGASPLFSDLSGEALSRALRFFAAAEKRYAQGSLLQQAGAPMPCFGLVLAGVVQVHMDDINGGTMILASVGPGETFGESLCFLRIPEVPVRICAAEDACVLWLRPDAVRAGARDDWSRELVNRFISMLAERTLSMNNRIQILSKKSLREKLIAFFTEYSHKFGSAVFSVPFDRSSMAAYLGTERSALSRELSRMKAEGLIDYYRNSFRLLRPHIG